MKILYICGDTGIEIGGRKGAATHVRETCHALMNYGHDVLLVAANIGDRSQVRVPFIEIPAPRAKWMGGDFRLMTLNRRMRRVLAQAADDFQPDAVYERYSLYQTAGLELCAKRRLPRILEVNTLLAREQAARLHWPKWAARVEKWLWRREAAIICVSHMLKRLMIQSAKLAPETMTAFEISPVAVDPEVFHPDVKPVERESLGLAGRKIAGYMGTLTSWHGVELFFEAARELRDGGHNVVILAVGGEPERIERLRKRAAAENLASHLVFYGSIPYSQVPSFLAAMDVCLIADTQDWSSPTKFFEFAALARPVVAAECPAVAEVLGPAGDTGVMFKRGDGGDMAAKIVQLINNPERAAAIGRAARKRVLENYTWYCNVRTIMRIYAKLGAKNAREPQPAMPCKIANSQGEAK